jgi:N6-L-threonylcarbamoyladenine synthase
MSLILAIESSCDETGVAVVRDGHEVLCNKVATQIDLHRAFGGVVPELASRQHTRVISQLVEHALQDAGVGVPGREGGALELDAIAATNGPGLMGALLVGSCFARALAYAWGLPYVPVQHIEGHLFSAFLAEPRPEFPFLALVVSGGHTQLVLCRAAHDYEILGATRDDAVGESFDKVARLLHLPYPGGPSIQKAAEGGNSRAFDFPRALRSKDTLEFSYSGLKTAVLYALQSGEANTSDVAAAFQEAAIDSLLIKTKQALQQTGMKRLVLAGGVAANQLLREKLATLQGVQVHMPPMPYCMDNAAMIAAAAESLLQHGRVAGLDTVPDPAMPLV